MENVENVLQMLDELKIPSEAKDFEKRIPAIVNLLQNATEDSSPAVKDWIKHVVPKMMSVFSFQNAKGMSQTEANLQTQNLQEQKKQFATEASRQKAVAKLVLYPDQSLSTHNINAALGAWTIVNLANLSDLEQRLYLAGVTMHDLNKMLGFGVEMRLEDKQRTTYEGSLKAWAQRLDLWQIMDISYWEDVAFLAHNAEALRGENRTLSNYHQFQTNRSLLEDLSHFVRLADLLASQDNKHPDSLCEMTGWDKPVDIIRRVLHGNYVLRYHKTADNRGLITQLIHNAVLEEAQQHGWVPFLYFPDGVTYLAPKNNVELDLQVIPQQVRESLIETVAEKLGQLVARSPTGIRYKPEFIELLTPARACQIAIERTLEIINDKKPPVTEERKAKTVLRQGATVTLDFNYSASFNADRIAEGMFGLSKIIFDYYGGDREAHGETLIRALDLDDLLEAFKSIEFTGGVGYPWYYIGGHYIKRNPGLDTNDVEKVMQNAVTQILTNLGEPEREKPFDFLEDYIGKTLSIGQNKSNWDFKRELSLYSVTKKPRNSDSVCVICNGESTVGAGHSTFSNKQKVSYSDSKPKICAICQAENLLRRLAMGRDFLSGDGTKFLHLYPTYFFTPITAKMMQVAYQDFKQATFAEIAKPYQQADYDLGAIIHSDVFQILEIDNPKRRLDRVAYPEGQMHGYYLLGIPYLGRDPTDTENWVMPALLGMLSPLLFGTKAVVSDSMLPVYTSGADFPETVVLDGPHSFWQHGIKKTTFRLDELEKSLHATLALYGLVSEAYKDSKNYTIWNQLGSVARNLDSEALSIFGYADRISSQASKGKSTVTSTDGMAPWLAQRLMMYYKHITNYYEKYQLGGKNEMELIKETVEKYTAFYRAKGSKGRSPSAYSRLRPLNIAIDTILRLPTTDELDDKSLQLQINGGLLAFLDRIRGGDRTITGFIPKGMSKNEVLYPAVVTFTNHVVEQVLGRYCNNDRAILRKRLNDLKNGCEAYYVLNFSKKDDSESEEMEMN
jgi:CRISPR-associated protein Csc3